MVVPNEPVLDIVINLTFKRHVLFCTAETISYHLASHHCCILAVLLSVYHSVTSSSSSLSLSSFYGLRSDTNKIIIYWWNLSVIRPEDIFRGRDVVLVLVMVQCKKNCWLTCVQAVYERLQLHKNNSAVNNSSELCHYVTTCAQLAWSLTAQRPSYALEYQLSGAVFDYSRHQRFHTSDPGSYVVTQVVWPGLVEQSTGVCVSRAVVVT